MSAAAEPSILEVADAVGGLMEAWGFKRNMGRLWTLLYLEARPLPAAELGERLGLSAGAVSMLVSELIDWDAVKKTWIPGERKDYYSAETNIWKMVSRVFRERELRWIQNAAEAFARARHNLEAVPPSATEPSANLAGLRERVAGLAELSAVGAHLLQTILDGNSVDTLPLKSVGELARAARAASPPRED